MFEMTTIYKCDTCGNETDYSNQMSCTCGECKKDFCIDWKGSKCFNDHMKDCPDARALIITNPQWVMNFVGEK